MAKLSILNLSFAQQQRRASRLDLLAAYEDFRRSRRALQCSSATLDFYHFTSEAFVDWLRSHDVNTPGEVTACLVRDFLAELVEGGKADASVHDFARAVKTLLRFWHTEGYLPTPIIFSMPKVRNKRQPTLTAEEVSKVREACTCPRDRALVTFLVDSGLRRAEVCKLDCGDLDLTSGRVRVRCGKGGQDRTAVISAETQAELLAYRPELRSPEAAAEPLFLSRIRKHGRRLTGTGLLIIFRRLSKQTGLHITPHALRRTCAILSLRAGMDLISLKKQLGHSSLEMVERYVQLIDDDLLDAHRAHGPIENLARLREQSTAGKEYGEPAAQKSAPLARDQGRHVGRLIRLT